MLRSLITLGFVGAVLALTPCLSTEPWCSGITRRSQPPTAWQPSTDNASCAEMVTQCQLWVTNGLFQNEYCVLASFCYAWSNTDDLLQVAWPASTQPVPKTSEQTRLSETVFSTMSKGAQTLSQQNVIDAYYGALTGTWAVSGGGVAGSASPVQTSNNGPYPTSPQYVIDFWAIISAWTGFCDTREIPYSNLADYLSYAAGSNYNITC